MRPEGADAVSSSLPWDKNFGADGHPSGHWFEGREPMREGFKWFCNFHLDRNSLNFLWNQSLVLLMLRIQVHHEPDFSDAKTMHTGDAKDFSLFAQMNPL